MRTPPLSNYLKMHRKRSGLSQDEMALLVGASHGSKVSRYEMSRVSPPLDILIAYEYVFGGSAERLFSGTHDRVASRVRRRAASMTRKLRRAAPNPIRQRKLNFLSVLLHP